MCKSSIHFCSALTRPHSATVVANYKAEEGISHVSTGGGASLCVCPSPPSPAAWLTFSPPHSELLEGKTLPGVAELSSK